MKKGKPFRNSYFARILTAILVMVFFVCSFTVGHVQGAASSGEKLIVGVPTDRCPIFYIDNDTDEIVGIGVNLMDTAASAAGFRPVYVEIKEKSLKEALDNREYDVILPFGSAIESASGQASVVSDNLFQTPFSLVTLPNRKIESFENLRVGMPRTLAGAADTVELLYPEMDIVLYDSMEDCVKALRNRRVDAILHNSYVWSYILQKPASTGFVLYWRSKSRG